MQKPVAQKKIGMALGVNKCLQYFCLLATWCENVFLHYREKVQSDNAVVQISGSRSKGQVRVSGHMTRCVL